LNIHQPCNDGGEQNAPVLAERQYSGSVMTKKLAGSGRFKSRKPSARQYPSAVPKIPENIESLFLATNQSVLDQATSSFQDKIVTSQILYKPGLYAVARVTFEGTRWEIFHERDVTRVIPFPAAAHMTDWENRLIEKVDPASVSGSAEANSFFLVEENQDFSPSHFQSMQEQFVDYLTTNETLALIFNPHLRLYRKLDETEESFTNRCLEAVREENDQERKQLLETILRQEERLKEKLGREYREHGLSNQSDMQTAKENQASARIEAQASGKTATLEEIQAEIDAQQSFSQMEDIQRELATMQKQKDEKLHEFEESLVALAKQREKDIVRVNRGNVKTLRFGILWLPFTEFIIQEENRRRVELIQSFQ
jgi:flagellar biosynthesis GTPase FlhF